MGKGIPPLPGSSHLGLVVSFWAAGAAVGAAVGVAVGAAVATAGALVAVGAAGTGVFVGAGGLVGVGGTGVAVGVAPQADSAIAVAATVAVRRNWRRVILMGFSFHFVKDEPIKQNDRQSL